MKPVYDANVRIVDYFGIKIVIADPCAKWLATDANGMVYYYHSKPATFDEDFAWAGKAPDGFYVTTVDLEGMDWKDTLVYIGDNDDED